MARSLGVALAPFQVLAAGKLRTDAEERRRKEENDNGRVVVGGKATTSTERTESELKMSRALEKVAAEVGAKSITSSKSCSMASAGAQLIYPLQSPSPMSCIKHLMSFPLSVDGR